MNQRKHILVTGGAGYIGSHACKALALAGYTPVTYDNLSRGHEWAVKWGPFERGDILDGHRLKKVMAHYRPEAVMHFAAFAYVGESVEHPGMYYENNVAGSLSLLRAMIAAGIRNIVFSSTCAVYGEPDRTPIAEDHRIQPINPYGYSKMMVERMLADFDRAHGIRYASLRYFNAAGADAQAETGEVHDPETHLIPLVLQTAAGQRDFIEVFGDDYDTPDGTCVRDYIHVSDLASAHVLAMKYLESGGNSRAYNLGNGNGYSVRQVIDIAKDVVSHDIPLKIGPRRPGDSPELIGSSDRIMTELGWNQACAELYAIVDTAWRWHRAFYGIE